MLIDDITITFKAGDGGDGVAEFNKNMMSLGPVGGDGGKGGDVYCQGISDVSALGQFRNKKDIVAKSGAKGRGQFRDGEDGGDVTVFIPTGTVVTNVETGGVKEIVNIGEKILVARGGRGGKGNFKFRSPINTSPKEFTRGKPGENWNIHFELKLIADVGLIGLPNGGKSSLLNELTGAKSKVANYPFTTLEPNLGVYYELILADIPGLIEGASSGKGLGIKFLQHIERTNTLFHLISVESEHPAQDYKVIKKELGKYNKAMNKKEEYVFLSKSDMASVADVRKKVAALKKIGIKAIPISIIDEESLNKVKKILNDIKKKKFKGEVKEKKVRSKI